MKTCNHYNPSIYTFKDRRFVGVCWPCVVDAHRRRTLRQKAITTALSWLVFIGLVLWSLLRGAQ
jgi:hypothetical protein